MPVRAVPLVRNGNNGGETGGHCAVTSSNAPHHIAMKIKAYLAFLVTCCCIPFVLMLFFMAGRLMGMICHEKQKSCRRSR